MNKFEMTGTISSFDKVAVFGERKATRVSIYNTDLDSYFEIYYFGDFGWSIGNEILAEGHIISSRYEKYGKYYYVHGLTADKIYTKVKENL